MSDSPILDIADEIASPTDAMPKRRGRPPGSKNKATGGVSSRARAGKAWVTQQAKTLVGAVNLGLVWSPLKDDALSEQEMDMLSEAIAAEAMSSERILKWLEKAGIISPHFMLIRAIGTIAIPRLQRHGIIPGAPSLDSLTDEQREIMREYYTANGYEIPPELATTVPVETRGASHNNGGYGNR